MLPNPSDELAKKYLEEELGLTKEQAAEAAPNILGLFEVLFRIDERLKKQAV